MGSFNTTCALTGEVISHNTETVMVLLTRKGRDSALAVHTWDQYSPIPIIFEGKYNSYGRLKDAQLFQSKEILNDKQLKIANEYIFNELKNNTNADYERSNIFGPKNLDELMNGEDWGFCKKDRTAEVLRALLDLSNEIKPEEALKAINVYEKMFGRFNSIDEVKEKIEDLEENRIMNSIPIKIVYFEKEAFLKLVNEYGSHEGEPNEDIYSQIIQYERSNDLPPERGTRCIMLGEENFAGANYPVFKLSNGLKEITKASDIEILKNLEDLHIQDLTLVNDYFSMLGRSWMPSMTVNEDIEVYGHSDALDFQRKLLTKSVTNKPKP